MSFAYAVSAAFIETLGRSAAKISGLIPKGTLYVLLKNLKLKNIIFDDFLSILSELIESGFRLKEEIYIKVIEEARQIDWQSDKK